MREDIRLISHKKNSFKNIGIAVDEYNPWYREEENMFVPMNLSDSLLVASYFNIFFRNADVVQICNMAQLVNTIPAMAAKHGTAEFFRQGISYVQEMMKVNSSNTAIDVWCNSPEFSGSYYPFSPVIDVSASKYENKIYLNIVNRDTHKSQPIELCIANREIKSMRAKRLWNKRIEAVNSFLEPHELKIEDLGEVKNIILEPLSLYVVEIQL